MLMLLYGPMAYGQNHDCRPSDSNEIDQAVEVLDQSQLVFESVWHEDSNFRIEDEQLPSKNIMKLDIDAFAKLLEADYGAVVVVLGKAGLAFPGANPSFAAARNFYASNESFPILGASGEPQPLTSVYHHIIRPHDAVVMSDRVLVKQYVPEKTVVRMQQDLPERRRPLILYQVIAADSIAEETKPVSPGLTSLPVVTNTPDLTVMVNTDTVEQIQAAEVHNSIKSFSLRAEDLAESSGELTPDQVVEAIRLSLQRTQSNLAKIRRDARDQLDALRFALTYADDSALELEPEIEEQILNQFIEYNLKLVLRPLAINLVEAEKDKKKLSENNQLDSNTRRQLLAEIEKIENEISDMLSRVRVGLDFLENYPSKAKYHSQLRGMAAKIEGRLKR